MFCRLVLAVQRSRRTIFTKLLIAFGIIFSLILINAILRTTAQVTIVSYDTQQQQKIQLLNQLQTLNVYLNNENLVYNNALFVVYQSQTKRVFETQINSLIVDLQASTNLAQFVPLYRAYEQNLSDISQTLDQQGLSQAQQVWPQAAAAFNTNAAKLNAIIDVEKGLLDKLTVDKNNFYQLLVITTTILGFLALLASVVLPLTLSYSIGKPLREIKRQLDEIAKGNLVGEIKVENRDEIGAIAAGFNNAINNLRQILTSVQVGEELVFLSQNLASNTKEQVNRTTEQLASVTQTLVSVQELTSSARQIANNTAVVVKATEQTNQQIGSVQQIATDANQFSSYVEQVALDTADLVDSTSQAIDELSNRLGELSSNTQQISQVIEIINNVASETHILALNAAIEAAGAGAYGQRFGVVAREVKELANRTQRATTQVRQLIGMVQQATTDSVEQLVISQAKLQTAAQSNQNLGQEVSKLNQAVSQTVHAVKTIVQAAQIVAEQTNEIRIATSQQENASTLIFGSLGEIGRMSKQNAESSKQVAGSTEQLDRLAYNLTRTLATVNLS